MKTPKIPGKSIALLAALLFSVTVGPAVAAPAAQVDELALDPDWKAVDQEEARQRAGEIVPFVDQILDECQLCRQQRLRDVGLGVKDIVHSYFLLDSPIINRRENHYGPVRFMHSKHAAAIQDCAICHHARPADKAAKETVRCSACHQESFREDHPERLGLKAAYHQQCIKCHRDEAKGPVDCSGCHPKNVPDHTELVKLSTNPAPWEVTTECLRCHASAGEDMLSTAHWLWKGHSAYTLDQQKKIIHGKGTTSINNF
jgi:hypothetical protein